MHDRRTLKRFRWLYWVLVRQMPSHNYDSSHIAFQFAMNLETGIKEHVKPSMEVCVTVSGVAVWVCLHNL